MLGSTKEQRSNRRLLWSGAPDCPVHHWTVSGAPKDFNANSPPSGILQSQRAIIHRTVRCTPDCPVYTGQCPVLQRDAAQELASLGKSERLLRYNSPDMSGVHRTVRCDPGATATRRQRLPAAHLMHALRAQKAGAPIPAHRTMNRSCPVCTGHPGGPTSQKLQRSESNGSDDVAGAPDCPVCTGLSGAPSNRQPPPTVMFGGWGYKYPNHPTIHCIQVFHFSTTYKS